MATNRIIHLLDHPQPAPRRVQPAEFYLPMGPRKECLALLVVVAAGEPPRAPTAEEMITLARELAENGLQTTSQFSTTD